MKKLNDLVKTFTAEMKDLKETLISIQRDHRYSIYSIDPNIRKISKLLQEASDNNLDIQQFCSNDLIYDLLYTGPFTRTVIPLNLIEMLISAGSDVNAVDIVDNRCLLNIAIQKGHYNVIRLLVEHGANRFNNESLLALKRLEIKLPVVLLASQPNAPLDLFDILVTSGTINNCSLSKDLPLHQAVFCGHTAIALHLIKLGASVDQQDGWSRLPVGYLVSNSTNYCNIELFTALLPSKAHGMEIFTALATILGEKGRTEKTETDLFLMLHQLLQRLSFHEPLRVGGEGCFNNYMTVNSIWLTDRIEHGSLPAVHFLCSLILVELQFDFASIPNEIADKLPSSDDTEALLYARAFDDVWRRYREQCRVKSLLRLCIHRIRNCLKRLDDDSFQSLPVPPFLLR